MNIYEMGLMSLILSYHKSNKVICFSNEYAELRLGLSKNTISRTISSLRQKGFIETDMTAALPAEQQAEYKRTIPAGRFATPAEVASVVAWLASDDAAYISGAVIPVDGGLGMDH
jgi:enoyl-[acyl-carrier-protein] reductase (NADH)